MHQKCVLMPLTIPSKKCSPIDGAADAPLHQGGALYRIAECLHVLAVSSQERARRRYPICKSSLPNTCHAATLKGKKADFPTTRSGKDGDRQLPHTVLYEKKTEKQVAASVPADLTSAGQFCENRLKKVLPYGKYVDIFMIKGFRRIKTKSGAEKQSAPLSIFVASF